MAEQHRTGLLSRRQLLGGLATLAGAAFLAACGGTTATTAPAGGGGGGGASAAPSSAAGSAVPAAGSGAASAAPASAAASGAAASSGGAASAAPASAAASAGASAPASAAAASVAPTKELTIIAGKFNVWFSANWNVVTDEAVGQVFVDWGKKNNIQVEWQSIPGSPVILQKESAALAAGQPPEIDNNNGVYWYSQGEFGDVTDLLAKYKDKEGGMYPLAISSLTAPDGKNFAVPYAVDCWPVHWRTDAIGEKTGGKMFETWDKLIELGPSIQQPPRTNLFAFCLGHEGDHINNLATTLWGFGGRLNDEKGVPDIKNPANKAALETIVKIWKANLIPKETFAQTVTSWNNETYQKGRGLMAINPATIMGWLLVNDKDLGDKTGLSLPPKGSAGSFAEGSAIGFGYFKKAKQAGKAVEALEYLLQPENLQKISKSVEGRFVPVYKGQAKGEFWEKSKFAQLAQIAESGRVRNWPAPPQPWLADVQDAKYTLSDMMDRIINQNQAIDTAVEWAQGQMMESYQKFVKQ